jgi:hypothetical protein
MGFVICRQFKIWKVCFRHCNVAPLAVESKTLPFFEFHIFQFSTSGLPDGYTYFHTRNAISVYFGWKTLVDFMAIWYFVANLVNFKAMWYFCGHFGIFPRFGLLHQEKSGNPVPLHL